MPHTKLRWGLLSTARINRALIPAIRAAQRSELVAVASRTLEQAERYAHEWSIPRAFGSYEAMLESEDVDVVYISLPNRLHAEWAIRALRAGKHVLCEKPLATRLEDVDAMITAARENGRVLAEAFMYRHHPQTLKVKALVDSGAIGAPKLVRGAFTFTIARADDIRLDPALDGGSLWDVGCYPVSYARYLFGREPLEAHGVAVRGASGVDETFVGWLRFGEDAFALFDSGFRAPERMHIEVVGSEGVIVVPSPFKPGARETIYLGKSSTTLEPLTVEGPEQLYLGEVEDMEAAALDGAPQRISLEDSRNNVAALIALYRAAGMR